jgi:hypothetical protein
MSNFQPITSGGQKPAPRNTKPLNQTPQSEDERPWWKFGLTTWLLIFGLIVINAGIFVKPEMLDKIVVPFWRVLGFVDVRFWPWWYWPVFWIVVIGLVGRYLLSERIEFAEVQGQDTDQIEQLRRIVTIIAVGLAIVMICVHSDLANHLRVLISQFYTIQYPWWTPSLVITLIIALLVIVWMIQRAQDENGAEGWSLRTTIGVIVGGVMGIAVIFCGMIAYTNGFFSSLSLSLSLPWWGWPAFWVAVITGLLTYRIFTAIQGKGATVQTTTTIQATAVPIQQAASAPAKPKGFNASVGGRTQAGFRAGQPKERTPLLERLGLSALSELGMLVWLIPVGLILLAVIGYICYHLMTMEWIDAEGYPISRPWWIWALPFVILALGALIWKVVLLIRENMEDGAFQSSRSRSASQSKPQKSRGFNVQSPGRSGFQRNDQESGLSANPFFWVAIVGGGILLLIIVLLLVFR